MRLRVRFRFNAETGEVELFQVDDLGEGPPLADHDARHDRAAMEIAGVIENNALIEEVNPQAEMVMPRTTTVPAAEPEPEPAPADQRIRPVHE